MGEFAVAFGERMRKMREIVGAISNMETGLTIFCACMAGERINIGADVA